MRTSVQGLTFYADLDLPECGHQLVWIRIKRVGKQLYQVQWMRELGQGGELSTKDEMAMQVGVIEKARQRLRRNVGSDADIYIT